MTAARDLLARFESLGVEVVFHPPEDVRLRFHGRVLHDLVAEARQHKAELLAELARPSIHEANDEVPTDEIEEGWRQIEMMRRGEVPDGWTGTTICERHGRVPCLPGMPDRVVVCGWCWTGGKPRATGSSSSTTKRRHEPQSTHTEGTRR